MTGAIPGRRSGTPSKRSTRPCGAARPCRRPGSSTRGRLLIDSAARVRAAHGGTVPGLLAAGSDAGGLYLGAYAGGLAPALVFGLAAARTALANGATAP